MKDFLTFFVGIIIACGLYTWALTFDHMIISKEFKCTDYHLFGKDGSRVEQCIEYKRPYENN